MARWRGGSGSVSGGGGRQQRDVGGGGSVTAQRWWKLGCGTAAAAVQSLVAVHSVTAAAQWQWQLGGGVAAAPQRNVGGSLAVARQQRQRQRRWQ